MLHLKTKRAGVNGLAYSPCGRWLAVAGLGGADVWDLSDPAAPPRQRPAVRVASDATRPALLPGDRLFFTTLGWFHLVDLRTAVRTGHRIDNEGYPEPTPSPDGRWLVEPRGDLSVWRLAADGTPSRAWTDDRRSRGVAAFSADSALLAFAGLTRGGPAVSVHDTATGTVVHTLTPVFKGFDLVLFSPDGNALVVGTRKRLAVYDLRAPQAEPTVVTNPDPASIREAAYSPDGKRLATVSDRTVRLWGTATWTPGTALDWGIGKLAALAVSPDGSTAAVASSNSKVVIWDLDG